MDFEELKEIIGMNDTQSLREALDNGVNVDMVRDGNHSLLMEAASMGSINCTNLLIQRGANVNHQSDCGYTALMRAAWRANIFCVDLLLQSEADPNLKDRNGNTALMHAYLAKKSFNVESRACMQVLLNDPRTDIDATDDYRTTLLVIAASDARVKDVEFLLEKGADLSIADREGFTPLMAACESLSLECIKILVREGAVFNAEVKRVLFEACSAAEITPADFWVYGYEPEGEGVEVMDERAEFMGERVEVIDGEIRLIGNFERYYPESDCYSFLGDYAAE